MPEDIKLLREGEIQELVAAGGDDAKFAFEYADEAGGLEDGAQAAKRNVSPFMFGDDGFVVVEAGDGS